MPSDRIDVPSVHAAMLAAARHAATREWRKLRDPLRRTLNEEQEFLARLAQARIDGEIDDDSLARELLDERSVLEEALRSVASVHADVVRRVTMATLAAWQATMDARVRRTAGSAASKPQRTQLKDRRLNARPDTADFRDLMYTPTLVEVGTTLSLAQYRKFKVPVLDQGREGACTGYGLATVVHYLLRARRVQPDRRHISPRMLYQMARRYDEWPGEAYEGSSCRGAMKGWHKHGVCSAELWPHEPRNHITTIDARRAADARRRPLGAYFRVNHKDLVAMHAAIAEVGALYASATVHSGWDRVKRNGAIPFGPDVALAGGHAFAIVAYDAEGFWIQNSWGVDWGLGGFARISYEDWLQNGSDVWVARLGVPMQLVAADGNIGTAFSVSARARAIAYDDLRPHVVSLGNDGQLKTSGPLGTTPAQLHQIIHSDFATATRTWQRRRQVQYAHGGLVDEDSAIQRVAEYREAMLQAECYPLAFIWHSDFWTTLRNILGEALRRRRPEGAIEAAKDFVLDRLDDAIEPLARVLGGKAQWSEMKENALAATESATGGARMLLDEIAGFVAAGNAVEIHVIGHSAGSILHAPLLRHLVSPAPVGLGLRVASCTLWAPACTLALFEQYYAPLLQNGIDRFALYTLTDQAERDDHCAHIYHKSLLYLVSHAFEKRPRIPLLRPGGEPILGMEKFVLRSEAMKALWKNMANVWVKSPNTAPIGDVAAARACAHGAFDDDEATVKGTLARILQRSSRAPRAVRALDFSTGRPHLQDQRRDLDAVPR